MYNKVYSIWYGALGINEKIKFKLYNRIGSYKDIYALTKAGLLNEGLTPTQADNFIEFKSYLNEAEKIYNHCEANNIDIIDISSINYPESLKHIYDPPIVLYGKGNIESLGIVNIAIVGSRNCSDYSLHMVRKIACELSNLGITVVSGMARGIDEAAHKGALNNENRTVAVLGTGVDVCYPAANRELYNKILSSGYIVSEYIPGTTARGYHFPRRNRIISGLSVGVVIGEAVKKSGSLITAEHALEQGKEVFVIPGDINRSTSYGSNSLIQEGAKLIQNIDDIIESLPDYVRARIVPNVNTEIIKNSLDKVERLVYDCLSWHPSTRESVQAKTELSDNELDLALLKLQVKKIIERIPANRYVRFR